MRRFRETKNEIKRERKESIFPSFMSIKPETDVSVDEAKYFIDGLFKETEEESIFPAFFNMS